MKTPFRGHIARLAVISAGVSGALAAPAAAAPATVTVANDAFSPSAVTVNVGESVTWNFNEASHNVKGSGGIAGNDSFGKGTYTKTFSTAGTFSYVCEAHADKMKGTVTVEAATAQPAPGQPAQPAAGQPAAPTAGPTAAAATTGAAWSFPTAEDRMAPAVRALRASMPRRGTRPRLALTLSEDATVVVGVRRVLTARTATAAMPAIRLQGKKGVNRFALKLRGLRRGRYRLRVVAVDGAGNESSVRTATLRVAR